MSQHIANEDVVMQEQNTDSDPNLVAIEISYGHFDLDIYLYPNCLVLHIKFSTCDYVSPHNVLVEYAHGTFLVQICISYLNVFM